MELTVEKRDASTKAKSLRDKGLLPAVIYGRSEESTPITLDAKTFGKLYKAAGESTVITIKGLGADKDALIHEVEFDAVKGQPVHVDFYAIEKGQKVTVSVPLEFDGVAPAIKDLGGVLVKVIHELEITVAPKDLPQHIMVDISALKNIDDQILVSDLKLPASAEVSVPMDEVVATAAKVEEEAETETPAADLSSIQISEERGKKEEETPAAE
ncbi:MAG TPA: 50S ribosomal protein L25 [Candidatus Paceibacterota bacterium]